MARGCPIRGTRASRAFGERGGVDDVAVAHARIHDVVVSLRDVLAADHLDLRDDAVRGAEVEHLLGLGDAADLGARERLAAVDEGAQRQGDGLGRQAHVDEDAVGAQRGHVACVVQALGGHGAQDQVEGTAQGLEHAFLAGRVEVVGAEAAGIGLLGTAMGDDRDVRAHSLGDLHAHMSEATHTEDRDARSGAHVVMLERRVGGDACAQQGCAGSKIQLRGDMQREVLTHGEAA